MLNLAVPHLTKDLQPSASQLLWILDVYGFLLAGFLMTMGTLGDRPPSLAAALSINNIALFIAFAAFLFVAHELPPDILDVAQDTMGGAVAAAERLAPDAGDALPPLAMHIYARSA